MKIIIKKIKIVTLIISLLYVNLAFAKIELFFTKENQYNFDETFVNIGNGPNYILNGKLMIIGDSYAFLLCDNTEENLNYVVHPGYNVSKIKNEFMSHIKSGDYSYVYLCIGPNDFMEQTDLGSFRNTLNELVSILEGKSTKIIFSTYWDPDYTKLIGQNTLSFENKCYKYDLVMKEIAEQRNLIFVDTSELLRTYGWDDLEGVHPSNAAYTPFLYKIMDAIALDLEESNKINN